MLVVAEPFLQRNLHPTQIVAAYYKALEAALHVCSTLAVEIDVNNREEMRRLIGSCIGTKFSSRYGMLMVDLAIDSVMKVVMEEGGRKEVDIKRFAKVEKVRARACLVAAAHEHR